MLRRERRDHGGAGMVYVLGDGCLPRTGKQLLRCVEADVDVDRGTAPPAVEMGTSTISKRAVGVGVGCR